MKNISVLLVFERQMSMFGHVATARLSSNNPAHRILSCGNPPGRKRDRGRPLSTRLRQMEGFCRRIGADRERSLAKKDALAYRARWRARLSCPLTGVQTP